MANARVAWVDTKRLRPMAWVWLLLGVPVLLFGVLLLAAAAQFDRAAVDAEGVVVRHEDADWLHARGKLVRADFTQAIDSHWRSRAHRSRA